MTWWVTMILPLFLCLMSYDGVLLVYNTNIPLRTVELYPDSYDCT